MDDTTRLWLFLPIGYLTTIAVETPILLLGLSARHSLARRLFAGAWLTACTYPVVVLVVPPLMGYSWQALLVQETFAPLAECLLFWAAFGTREEWGKPSFWRDMAAIVVANLASFGVGELLNAVNWFTGS